MELQQRSCSIHTHRLNGAGEEQGEGQGEERGGDSCSCKFHLYELMEA